MQETLVRFGWRMLAYGAIGLGTAGLVVPLLPTTPFLLLAAWAAPKGSPRLASWLWQHPRLGPALQAWQQQRAIPKTAKRVTTLLLALSWLILWLGSAPTSVLGVTASIFCCVTVFLWTRPDATPTTSSERNVSSTVMIKRF